MNIFQQFDREFAITAITAIAIASVGILAAIVTGHQSFLKKPGEFIQLSRRVQPR